MSFLTNIETFRALLVMTITGAAITAALFAVKPLMRNRLPKTAQCCLWLVALAAFLVPASAFIAVPADAPMPPVSSAVNWYVVTAEEIGARIEPYERTDGNGYAGVPEEYRETVDALAMKPWVPESVDWAKMLWCIGALVSLSIFVLSYHAYLESVVKKHNREALPEHTSMLAALAAKPPRLYINAKATAPMLIGLFRPKIILPDREYSDGQLRSVLLHELTHLRRKDVLVKWLAVIACSLHWFNPIVWLARRELDRACELACDEAVIRKLDADGKQSYGDTLIAVAADSKMPRTVLSTTMCERKKSLKERLGAIMSYKRHTRAAVIVSAALIIGAILAACALGAGSGAENIVLIATIEEIYENAILVAVENAAEVGFDIADVDISNVEPFGFNLLVGRRMSIEIEPEIMEKYPVRVKAIRFALAETQETGETPTPTSEPSFYTSPELIADKETQTLDEAISQAILATCYAGFEIDAPLLPTESDPGKSGAYSFQVIVSDAAGNENRSDFKMIVK
jgi:beta-lactamase regulating signal transducer with metallopeptidase domain